MTYHRPAHTDFAIASANAEAEAGTEWAGMPNSERSAAIYAQLRLLDEAAARTMMFPIVPPSRYALAGKVIRQRKERGMAKKKGVPEETPLQ